MNTREVKKRGVEEEPLRKEAGAETERKEGLKELLDEQGEAVESSMENLKAGGEKDIEAVEKVGDKKDVEEIKEGVKKIGKEAEGAKDIYKKEVTDTQRDSKTEKEIMGELEKINDKIDKAIRKGLVKEEKEFRKERERLFGLLGNKYDDIGAEAGYIGRGLGQKAEGTEAGYIKEIAEERQKPAVKEEVLVKTDDKAIETGAISEKANEEIKKILKDPASELSILMKAANFREDYIQKLKDDLEKAKVSKVDKEERVKFYEKNIVEHEATLEKHKKRIKEIINEIEEKNSKKIEN